MELKKLTTRDLFFSIFFFLATGGLIFWVTNKVMVSVLVGVVFLIYYFIVNLSYIIVTVTTVMIACFGIFIVLMSIDRREPLELCLYVIAWTIAGFLMGCCLQKISEKDKGEDSEVYEDYGYDEPHVIAAEYLNICLIRITKNTRKIWILRSLKRAIKALTDDVDIKEIDEKNLTMYQKISDRLMEIKELIKKNEPISFLKSLRHWREELEKIQ